jgi:tripartite-type tricarboxylate transporter receptor subunit TctC
MNNTHRASQGAPRLPSRRAVLAAGAAAVASLSLPASAQANYPNHPIRILVPFPAGGSTDPLARLIGQKLTDAWGQAVIVDNRPGGNTVIGTEALTKYPADGHTLLYTASTHVINSILMPSLPYDSVKDFQPVCLIVRSEFVLVVHPSVPANNLQEFIALAKSKPGVLNYATSGNGNPNHLAGENFAQVAGVKLNNVPYKGGGPAITDLLGGQVQAMFSVPTSVAGHIKSGKLRALAYTGSKPLPGLNVPTFAQAGLPNFDMNSWNGIFVAAGTPRPIVDKLAAEISKILAMPDVKEKFAAQGQDPYFLGPDQFAAMLASDRTKYANIIKTANIRMD